MFISKIWLFDWYFPQFCTSDMSKYGYLEVFQRVPFDFEITRVDCTLIVLICLWLLQFHHLPLYSPSLSELGIWVRPRKARALLWNNMDEKGKCEPMSIHKANKVEKGRKIILQRW